jgi:transmembrane sensor
MKTKALSEDRARDGMDRAEDRASLEATRWLVALHEAPDDREVRRRFDEWRCASPLNATAWSQTERLRDVAATMPAAHADIWKPVLARRQRSGSRRWQLGAAAMALAACVALLVVPPIVQRLQADHMTVTAEVRKVVLQDGSEVTLAPDSAIAVSYEAAGRRVRLLSGEAFFNVKPDPSQPFRVLAADVETVVVGTSFDVRLYPDGVAVSVEQGVVRVGPKVAMLAELMAGQAVRVTSAGEVARLPVPPEMVAAWRDGQLVAQNVALRDAVDQLRRYYAGTIVLASASLGDRRITGAYNLADPEDALRAIAQAHGAKVRRITPWLLVVSDS